MLFQRIVRGSLLRSNAASCYSSLPPKVVAQKRVTAPAKVETHKLVDEIGAGLRVQSILENGLVVRTLNEQPVSLLGPALIYDNEFFLWDVPMYGKQVILERELDSSNGVSEYAKLVNVVSGERAGLFDGWTSECFSLFQAIKPPPEIVVFGTGSQMTRLPENLRKVFQELGIQLEVLSSKNASDTYNLLQQDNRRVALCILPNDPTSSLTGLCFKTFVEEGKA